MRCLPLAASLWGGLVMAAVPPVDLNTATRSQFERLPYIGPARAEAVLRWRESRGPFRSVDDLARVPGFGAGTVKRLTGRIAVQASPPRDAK